MYSKVLNWPKIYFLPKMTIMKISASFPTWDGRPCLVVSCRREPLAGSTSVRGPTTADSVFGEQFC